MTSKTKAAKIAEEQQAHVRSITRICRGPLMVEDEVWQKNMATWLALKDAADVDSARDFIVMLANDAKQYGPPGYRMSAPSAESLSEDWERLERLALPLIRLRGDKVGHACGQDVNELVVAGGFDGEEHSAECPGCGTEITWTAPVFY